MVPDRQIIMKVKLTAAGFKQADELALKFFILYQLCQEQLSQQIHYDFGLRNILSVLRTCGAQRRNSSAEVDASEKTILLRVLRDMNKSKLVDEDVPLFLSLTDDLFPDARVVENKYEDVESAATTTCQEQNLVGNDGNPNWFRSVIQLYETHAVRHGIMILGPSTAGKSTTIYCLAKSMLRTNIGKKFSVVKMNPKAITAPQMFGRLDSATNDWTDGIFSVLWRRACKKEGEWIWILLNGPVDAVWIENLNTVLDDNKTLTLANSDRIPMSSTLKLMFEIDSLDNASPATVSRAGMIYMSGFKQYGWTPFFKSWIKDWKDPVRPVLVSTLDTSGLVKLLFEKIELDWNPVFKMQQLNIFRQFMHLFTSMVYDGTGIDSKLNQAEYRDVLQEAVQASTSVIAEGYTNTEQALFQSIALGANRLVSKITAATAKKMIVYCIIWSFGAILSGSYRKQLQELLYGNNPAVTAAQLSLPKLDGPTDSIYNYFVADNGEWCKWVSVVPKFVFPEKSEGFGKILIPTVDNTCINQLVSKLNRSQFNVLLTGESGSGKTKNVQTYINNTNKEEFALREINFSSATTMGILQNNIAAFIDKRTGTTYGPPNNKKGIVFIDEINIPEINTWRDQPTNELTRQIIEERGYYSLAKPGEFHNIQDLTFIGSMPLPGGGRNDIPDRLKSHFDVIAVNLPNDDQLDVIFGTILKNHYSTANGFSEEICSIVNRLTIATRKLWLWTKKIMLPTPAKFHYIFNLRDLSRITQGLINTESTFITTVRQVIHIWANECYRILPDKFTSDGDIELFNKEIISIARQEFQDAVLAEDTQAFVNQGVKDANGEPKYIYIADFMRDPAENEDGDTNFEAEVPIVYEPVYEKHIMIDRILQFQTRHNEFHKRNQLDLVLFDQCLQHILRIARAIRIPGGNCLLVGVGGSGKQSCARLASFINDYSLFQLVMNKNFSVADLDDALRKKIKEVGIQGKGCSFLFTDNDVKDEIFLERINNLLTTGEIPALFPKEDVEDIINSMRDVWKRENPRKDASNDQLWAYFNKRARDHLHIVLCFSPANAKFRSRSQKFPGIISGCVTDWFQAWPRDALEEVAKKLVVGGDIDIKVADGSKTIDNLVEFFGNIHCTMNSICDQYFESYRRRTFVTPKSYLSFLATFKKIYKEKAEDLTKANKRLSVGLAKIEEAGQTVKKMQETLNKQNKILEQKSAEVQEKMKDVKIKTDEAEKVKAAVKLESDKCSAQAAETKIQEAGAQEGVDRAQPEVDKAEAALLSISKPDIDQIMGLATPPNVITRVVDMALIIFNEKMEKVSCDMEYIKRNGQAGFDLNHPLTASWAQSKVVMQKQFLDRLKNFNKNSITNEQCELLEAYILRMNDLREGSDAPAKASTSIAGLHNWCISMHKYHNIMLDFEPKLQLLREMRAKLKFAEENLKKANDLLQEKESALKILSDQLGEQQAALQKLNDEADLTRKRMTAASKLIEGLSDERVRWGKSLKELDDARIKLVGDTALASAFLSYCGPFNQDYRNKLITQIWIKDMAERKIPYTKNIENNLNLFLTTEDVIGGWRLQGLPTDELSTQNGLIVTSATRYPLLVDPQNQAATWIKNRYQDNLKVTNLNNKYFKNIMEDCLSQGIPVLIEDVEEELDPLLDPILEKQFQKKGRGFIVSFGDNKEQSVTEGFTLFITTKLPNPRYSPEIYAKTSVIDFTVTFGGLEAQLLSRIVNIERRDLEDQRKDLLQKVNEYKKKMFDLEEQLLFKLVNSQGDIVDDSSLIETLNETKKTTEETKQKIASAQETEKKINEARMEYEKAATRGSIIYFLICDMSNVNNMYQTSLSQFLELFDLTIDEAEANQNPADRINNIISHMTYRFFRYIQRGLFEKDKLLFILNLCLKIQMMAGTITQGEFMIFMRGGAMLDSASNRTKPANCNFINSEIWSNVVALSMSVPTFSNIITSLTDNAEGWSKWFESENPEDASDKSLLPQDYAKIKPFERMLLLRCFRQDRTMLAIGPFIAATLSQEYNEPFTPDYGKILLDGETNPNMPICFLLSLGSDPTGQLDNIARKAQKQFRSISMGQGQEENARKLIRECVAQGGFIVINNSHLALKFMVELDSMILDIRTREALTDEQLAELAEHKEEKQDKKEKKEGDKKEDKEVNIGTGGVFNLLNPKQRVHKDFRLIITTEPHPDFPIGLLQKCIKLTNDPPSGIRAGLMRTYNQLTQETLENYADRPQYLPLVYAIAFIHSIIIERKKFGPLGWCILYEFGQHDFNASIAFLQTFFSGLDSRNKQAKIESYKTIHYMVAEVHYGGRITDNYDRRLMNTYVAEWIDNKILDPNFLFGGVPKYSTPYYNQVTPSPSLDFVKKFVMENLSEIDKPALCCMHANAEITFRLKQATNILNTILGMQPRESSAGKGGLTREQMVDKYAKDMLPDLPDLFDLKREVPNSIENLGGLRDSLNVFLKQEIERMQQVLILTKNTLQDLQLAIAGQVVMTEQLQDAIDSIANGNIPKAWTAISWPSPNLAVWRQVLRQRCNQFTQWMKCTKANYPYSFWLTGFFNCTGFLTSVKQEITRLGTPGGAKWSLDKVMIITKVMKTNIIEDKETGQETYNLASLQKPEGRSVYIHGLFLEGAEWSNKFEYLIEAKPKILFYPMPPIKINAEDSTMIVASKKAEQFYNCPVYKTPFRTGLTYIFELKLACAPLAAANDKSGKQDSSLSSPNTWILRGTALLCQTE